MEAASVEEIVAGNLVIRPDQFLAHVDGQPVALTMRELSLLVALARRPGRVVSREELYAVVWQQPYRRCERSVDVYVGKLRQKLEDVAPDWRYIHTHCGFGYRFDAQPLG
jgi:DNA-binding response OmpR family regulator